MPVPAQIIWHDTNAPWTRQAPCDGRFLSAPKMCPVIWSLQKSHLTQICLVIRCLFPLSISQITNQIFLLQSVVSWSLKEGKCKSHHPYVSRSRPVWYGALQMIRGQFDFNYNSLPLFLLKICNKFLRLSFVF